MQSFMEISPHVFPKSGTQALEIETSNLVDKLITVTASLADCPTLSCFYQMLFVLSFLA